MILSYNTTKKTDDNFSDDSNEDDEEYMKIEDIMKKNFKNEQEKEAMKAAANEHLKKDDAKTPEMKNSVPKGEKSDNKDKEGDSALGSFFSWQDNISLGTSGQISKIDLVNQSSSLHSQIILDSKKENGNCSISRDMLQQPDVIQFLEQDSTVSLIIFNSLYLEKT